MAHHLLCGVLLLSFCGVLLAQRPAYPPAKKSDHTDTYGGTKVADPYRWLEETESKESEAWIAAEDKLTSAYLAALPGRERLKKDLTSNTSSTCERYAGPFLAGGRYFIFHNDGLQNQNVLLVMDSLNGKERLLLDPNTLRADGTAALSGLAVSRDGKYLAYSISQAGSDWQEWKVRDIATGKDLSDLVEWTKFTGSRMDYRQHRFLLHALPRAECERNAEGRQYGGEDLSASRGAAAECGQADLRRRQTPGPVVFAHAPLKTDAISSSTSRIRTSAAICSFTLKMAEPPN